MNARQTHNNTITQPLPNKEPVKVRARQNEKETQIRQWKHM